MGTVTYKNQPAIHKTRGSIPLVGTKHLYTVNKVLWPEEVEDFLKTKLIGKSLHVCSGHSLLGNIRLDLDSSVNPDIIADAAKLPFEDASFDTVFADPPYNFKFQQNHDMLSELSRTASKRIIFQQWWLMSDPYGYYKKAQSRFALAELYAWQPRTYFGRCQLIQIYDRIEE